MANQLLLLPLDSPLRGQVQNDRWVMAYQFFHLDRTLRDWPIEYDDGKVKITVTGSPIATMYDLEVLIYIVSLMAQRLERGEQVERTFAFSAGDFFRVAGIADSGSAYYRIEGALDRLQGTKVRTNIVTGGERTKEGFSWVDSYKLVYKEDTGVLERVTVTICEWLWRAIKMDNNKFIYDPCYFDLPPLEKRLYEMARAHCGQRGFRMWLDNLQRRVGSQDELRRFKSKLKAIAARKRPLPGYCLALKDFEIRNAAPKRGRPAKRTMVLFWRAEASIVETLTRADELDLVE
jgi:plasmid replication initiation protein